MALATSFQDRTARKLALLLVEDDDVDREFLIRQLQNQGMDARVETAADGAEALETLRRNRSRGSLRDHYIVLLDLKMPGMDGATFLKALRAEPGLAATVVFVVSGSRDEADIRFAYQHRAVGYLSKADLGPDCRSVLELIERYGASVSLPS